MKSSLILSTLLTLVAARPYAEAEANAEHTIDKRAGCAVNAEVINVWVEAGMTRWAIRHSADGTDEDYLNDIFCPKFKPEDCQWGCCKTFFNPQCFIENGDRMIHVSAWRGSDAGFYDCLQRNLDEWVSETGCTTG